MKHRIRASAVVIHNAQILTFLAVDPQSGLEYFFLPGGQIDKGETADAAAIRETEEETGYQIRVDTSSAYDCEYLFHWNGEDLNCLTIFYRGYLLNPFQAPKFVQDATYNKGHRWLPMANLETDFAYNAQIKNAILALAKI